MSGSYCKASKIEKREDSDDSWKQFRDRPVLLEGVRKCKGKKIHFYFLILSILKFVFYRDDDSTFRDLYELSVLTYLTKDTRMSIAFSTKSQYKYNQVLVDLPILPFEVITSLINKLTVEVCLLAIRQDFICYRNFDDTPVFLIYQENKLPNYLSKKISDIPQYLLQRLGSQVSPLPPTIESATGDRHFLSEFVACISILEKEYRERYILPSVSFKNGFLECNLVTKEFIWRKYGREFFSGNSRDSHSIDFTAIDCINNKQDFFFLSEKSNLIIDIICRGDLSIKSALRFLLRSVLLVRADSTKYQIIFFFTVLPHLVRLL